MDRIFCCAYNPNNCGQSQPRGILVSASIHRFSMHSHYSAECSDWPRSASRSVETIQGNMQPCEIFDFPVISRNNEARDVYSLFRLLACVDLLPCFCMLCLLVTLLSGSLQGRCCSLSNHMCRKPSPGHGLLLDVVQLSRAPLKFT